MALITKGKETIVEKEVSQLNNEDIEFLLNIIENSMVPGKYIGLGNIVIQKLQNQIHPYIPKWGRCGRRPRRPTISVFD